MKAGRPKEFDEHAVLEKAMNHFWTHGYNGTGLTGLLDAMGIARQSMYDTYGNKRALFIKTIAYYRDTRLKTALAILRREGPQLVNVENALRFFEDLAADRRARGCYVANTLVEMGGQDPEVATLLRETLLLLEKEVEMALRRARRQGELPRGKSPRLLAKALTNAMIGMAVSGKIMPDPAALSDICRGTLVMLC